MAGTLPITPAGMRKLKEELKHLQSVERPKISQEIETARAHGDLRENAEYHAAKEKQGHIEGRILELNDAIARAEVIDVTRHKDSDRVVFGCTVEILDFDNDKRTSYRLVGEFETDLKRRWISVGSPVARALIGKRVGDSASVQSPGGVREVEVVSIAFEDLE